ncbi:S-adenosyl-L-methionine-dependent methyltransferase [Lenzites betulinus]|nr:S-adenosyl-L-methionine-dependent methyltransferase [Lenzites betulinus]
MSSPPTIDDLDALATIYPHRSPAHFKVVRPQIEQRIQLVRTWGIKPGEKVLEIGCGQGDCTIVLAAAVGDTGSVTAVDPASLDYGSPFTLKEAQTHLRASSLGPRMNFVQADPLQFLKDTTEHYTTERYTTERYTTAVLAQCSWYFAKPEVFVNTLAALLTRVDRVCISEYSLTASDYRAVAHVLAALAQASLEVRKPTSTSNVRTVLSPIRLREAAEAAGWKVEQETTERPPEGMLDGKWEVDTVLDKGFLAQVEKAVSDEKERSVVLAARDAVQGAYGILQDRAESVRTMDIWVATLVPIVA